MKNGTLLSKLPLPASRNDVELYHITYASQNKIVAGYLAFPAAHKKCPVIVYCRGGIHRVGMVQTDWIEQMASCGFVVLAPSYRGNEGGEGHEDFGGEDRHDIYDMIPLASTLPNADEKKIAAVGFSRGGIGAFLAAIETLHIGAVVSWGGVTDLHLTYEERVDLRRMLKRVVGHPVKEAHAYLARSPIHFAESIQCPVLFIHGKEDELVSTRHADRLAARLERLEKPFEYWYYPRFGHHFPAPYHYATINEMCGWIHKNLEGWLNVETIMN
ncbi:alpha/beta hydrolase family protein [Aneurinibacillus tyrosinisolvens]|uniref:alpha/beta hydrolase family protein n=1 Tax=Aneurinibacillus tyrosinisolvens TaxID=1443435 RepID=UPI00063F5A4B|nr:prolyl oligopeptidase family serine peptidase [Aneurinibacillus tyrosinisolvens]